MHQTRHNPTRQFARSRGTAMTEALLVLPIIMIIAALLVFFGRAMGRLHRSEGMTRYVGWYAMSGVRNTIEGRDSMGLIHSVGPVAHPWHHDHPIAPRSPLLNQAFFDNQADNIHVDLRNLMGGEAMLTLINYLDTLSFDVADLMEAMSLDNPIAMSVEVHTSHDEPVAFFRSLGEAPIQDRLILHGRDWRFAAGWRVRHIGEGWDMPESYDWQPLRVRVQGHVLVDNGLGSYRAVNTIHSISGSNAHALAEVFLSGALDDALAARADNPLAQMIRNLYLHEGGYAGPHVYP